MHPGSDPMGAPPSFAARRPHAQQLGSFELPPPQMHKYPSNNSVTASQTSQAPTNIASVGNLLTPPNTNHSDGISSSGVSTSSAPYSTAMAYSNGQYIYSPPTQGSAAHYGYQATHHQQSQYGQARGGMFAPPRSDRQLGRQDSLGKGLNPPPYEMNHQLPPFTPSSNGSSMPSISTQHQHQQHQQHQQQHQQHQQHQHQNQQQHHHHQQMMNAQTPVSSSAPQQSPALAQESFRPPQPPTPTYNYHPSGTPQHSNFPYSTGPSPTLSQQQSPISAGGSMPRMSPAVSQGPMPSIPSQNPSQSPYQYQQRPSLQYPTGPSPVFSNVQNPSGQLALVGGHPAMMPGFNSGHAAAMPHFMGGHPQHQQPSANDRPFKCDQCPQSFNRNHDLKRHKRIHLAVKPFPCNHCDKSFSRKDALKRHILVKGCGKATANDDTKHESHSPKTEDVKPHP
ncbi:hypothetical protein BDW02DRAFT_259872 [Decorospora gaudefroyi]|uniref:C2H2-type domain-containing protein n=1 Tax=Decorospora gaudefroyi TaxID=184978 RepID=A0A6A5KK12_9PLEO|nr:hypothetical protein BDW02DRAFT_259872 [Decorospora gaudefroyi]